MSLETLLASGLLAFLFSAGVFVGRNQTKVNVTQLETRVELQYAEIIRRLELLERKP